MSGYIDIHSHVLYGLDDGAETMEESLAMLQLAQAAGTTDIVATPHANSRYSFRPDVIDQRIAELASLTSVRIHRGCDFHLHVTNIQDALANPRKYTINHGRYLLVELEESTVFSSTDRILSRLLDAGMLPIVTHPERNAQLRRQLDDLARWVELGCYAQVTAGSIMGFFGRAAKSCALRLIQSGLAHFVASDAHDAHRRTPRLREAHTYLRRLCGDERVRPLFFENPAAVLADQGLAPNNPASPPRPRKWYQFWAL